MAQVLHGSATTTEAIRGPRQRSEASVRALARSSRHGHLLARGNHADVAGKIHLSHLFGFPEPPLIFYYSECLCKTHIGKIVLLCYGIVVI